MTGHEKQVSPATPMPKGYKFLAKGNPYLTSLCRRMTIAEGKLLYVVTQKSKTLGLRAPRWIISEVFKEEKATRERRKEAVATRDSAIEKAFEDAAREQFPNMPAAETQVTIKRALKKRSGRVGRTGTLSIESKVRLAVAAHVRHVHTDYDKLIRQKGGREEARKVVQPAVIQLLQQWKGNKHNARKSARRKNKQSASKSMQPMKKPSMDIQSGPKSHKRNKKKKQQKGSSSSAAVAASGRTLRSAKASTAEDPILISSDSEDVMQDEEEDILDDEDLDALSDVLSLEESMDNDCSSDVREDSVIVLD